MTQLVTAPADMASSDAPQGAMLVLDQAGTPPARPPGRVAIHRVLARYADQMGVSFTLGGEELDGAALFTPHALLPVIAVDAIGLWQDLSRPANAVPLVKDLSLGTRLIDSDQGYFPLIAQVADAGSDPSSLLRILTFLLATRRVFGLQLDKKVDLKPLLMSWDQIEWDGDQLPAIPVSESFDPQYFIHEFKPSASELVMREISSEKQRG